MYFIIFPRVFSSEYVFLCICMLACLCNSVTAKQLHFLKFATTKKELSNRIESKMSEQMARNEHYKTNEMDKKEIWRAHCLHKIRL